MIAVGKGRLYWDTVGGFVLSSATIHSTGANRKCRRATPIDGAPLWPHMVEDTSASNPDDMPFCGGGTCCREVKSYKKHINFICSWHKAGKQIKTSLWHIPDPKRFRQAGNRLTLMRCSPVRIALRFCAWVQKNVSTQIDAGGNVGRKDPGAAQ